MVRGHDRMRRGERLEHVAEAGPGDFIHVPPFVPHREISVDPEQPLDCVLVRSDNEAVVVDIDTIDPVEPPEEVYGVDPIHGPPDPRARDPRPEVPRPRRAIGSEPDPAAALEPAAAGSSPRDTERVMADQNDQESQALQRRYQVRQVTAYQASWVERERGEEGRFTVQLILDNGVEEYILDVDSDDMEPMLTLLARSRHTTFDLERKVLMFSNLDAG